MPVKVDDTKNHKMHFENGIVSAQTADELNEVRARGGRIVSVGTTSLRLLESAVSEDGQFQAWDGCYRYFYHAGLSFPRHRFADHKFSPAAFNAFHVG